MHKIEQCGRDAADELARRICGCATTTQRSADVAAILAALEGVRIATIERCARVARQHAREAWDIANREGQNSACASGRNYGARQIEADILALKGGA